MMVKYATGTPSMIRDMNRYTVLRMVEAHGPLSRTDIVRKVGLSPPTVSTAVDYLLKCGLVKEVGLGRSSGGRKPRILEFNPEAGYVVGVDLGSSNLAVALSNLGGSIVTKKKGPPVSPQLGVDITNPLALLVNQLLREGGVPREKVLGIGVAAPGVTDPESGVVRLAPALGWTETPLKALLSRGFGVPVFVENDVNAAAIGEKLLGVGRGLNDFVLVWIGCGIGAGIVIGGELYRGFDNLAGEIGYLLVDSSWVQKEHGGFGCLESLASESAVLQRASRELGVDFVGRDDNGGDATRLFLMASSGDGRAREILRTAARHLAAGLANLTCVLSPRAIVLGGMTARQGSQEFVALIKEYMNAISPRVPEICVSALGSDAAVLGAVSIAVEGVKLELLDPAASAARLISGG